MFIVGAAFRAAANSERWPVTMTRRFGESLQVETTQSSAMRLSLAYLRCLCIRQEKRHCVFCGDEADSPTHSTEDGSIPFCWSDLDIGESGTELQVSYITLCYDADSLHFVNKEGASLQIPRSEIFTFNLMTSLYSPGAGVGPEEPTSSSASASTFKSKKKETKRPLPVVKEKVMKKKAVVVGKRKPPPAHQASVPILGGSQPSANFPPLPPPPIIPPSQPVTDDLDSSVEIVHSDED